ncbi:Cilia- and flagella-associated protein 58 [Microtus ochrogaster]|uniref:Cilia- and flagella-associated protein 58 n=1 Tax=Microtus ochrogaster TaxID=79684 RepID=A0A8J6KXU9_MICOH|nr:Cilia- and flagella-associated protein 58 [Microtus ochrogaster]
MYGQGRAASPCPSLLAADERAASEEVIRAGELFLPLTNCGIRPSGPCTLPGRHSRAGPDDEKGEKLVLEETAFEEIERDFQEVLNELSGDKSLEKFRVEYEKLHNIMRKSYDNEKRLMAKCRELNAEIVVNSAKVATALKLSQDDQTTIASLKKEIEKAWKMVDSAYDKEQKAKETILALKEEIVNLTKLVEQGSGLSMDQDSNIRDLLKFKEEVTKERDQLLSEVVKLRENLAQTTEQQQETERAKEDAEQTINQFQQEIQHRQNEASRESRKKEKLEKELKQIQTDMDSRQTEIKALQQYMQKSKEELQRLEQQLKEQKILNERAAKELEQFQIRNSKLQQENEQHTLTCEQLSQENQQKALELKAKEEEVHQMRLDIGKLNKIREQIHKKLHLIEDQKAEVEQHKETLKNQIMGLEREVESSKKQAELDKKAMDELLRERDILNKNMLKALSATQKQVDLVKLHEQAKRNLEEEIQNYKDEAQKQRKIIFQLEKERDRYINEASDLTQKLQLADQGWGLSTHIAPRVPDILDRVWMHLLGALWGEAVQVLANMEDIKVREIQIFDYRKKIAESETKLKQQQNLYEAVRSDRNLYSKNLVEAQDEITEMKRKLKIMTHQVDQLKEEISAKESALVKLHLEQQRIEKEKETLKAELQKLRQQALETKHFIEKQEVEERKLLRIIAEADGERVRQKKELDQVISERDILGSQLVRRNDELALLYEKIKIQQSVLNKGETQYNQRVEDMRILKLEIKKLRREKGILARSVANVEELRQELFHMQREFLKERTRCRALEEELENPMNVHRWRKLEASDPSTFELIQKIHTLQKRLISKTEEVVEKELLLQEKEKLYVELKHVLARQPGPEAAEQLQIYRHTLRERTKQLKVLSSELNMYESQSQEYKYEIERLGNELVTLKKKYLAQKRKELIQKNKDRIPMNNIFSGSKQSGPRFTGGGFPLNHSSKVKL